MRRPVTIPNRGFTKSLGLLGDIWPDKGRGSVGLRNLGFRGDFLLMKSAQVDRFGLIRNRVRGKAESEAAQRSVRTAGAIPRIRALIADRPC
ncbi:Hypothetical protein NTJ_15436 [Nesidiocoris tenuis]|uniref:Uncharacterized protein n=1 Tax=Nesidiocoris tenuis TaxID=355587 RepID=A0ABN7BFX5_9HEMI|nr:Hypothetical protein NTJ_15436 [Nesidiocoris tenuis]